jgi:undecaprenyl-diphosphatase
MGSLVGYGMLAYLLLTIWVKRRLIRVSVVSVLSVLVVAIGLSRLYLGVHYFSDIVGGYAAGLLWLSACITGLEIARRQPGTVRYTAARRVVRGG